MDHSIAYLMEFTNSPFEIQTIESEFIEDKKELPWLKKTPHYQLMDKHVLHTYYNKIGEAIKTTNK
jgi:hypothetical protein